MESSKTSPITEHDQITNDDENIDRAVTQMELLYKSRCVTPPKGSNVTVREIEKKET